MTVKFLSEQWATELKDGLNADDAFVKAIDGQSVRLQQIITGSDESHYWITIADDKVDMGIGDVDQPEATITQSYDTAAGLARGEVNAVTAFMTGKIKIAGNMMQLMGLQNALARLPVVMADMDIDY